MTDQTAPQLLLAQLADSGFPSGAFAHSHGLEQLVREDRVCSGSGLVQFVESVLRLALADADAVVAARSARAAQAGDLASIVAADRSLHTLKAACELRLASTAPGRRLLDEVAAHDRTPIVGRFREQVIGGHSPGTYAAAFGVVAGAHGAAPPAVAAMLLLNAATGLLQAALRLLRISHHDVQAALHDLRPMIVDLAAAAAARYGAPRAFHPAQEIAAMRHRDAAVRLFAS